MKNIPENTTTEQLKELFQRHGEVTKVVMPPGKGGQGKRDFGFVHYAERSSALKAVKDTEKYEIDGTYSEHPIRFGINDILAKPVYYKLILLIFDSVHRFLGYFTELILRIIHEV